MTLLLRRLPTRVPLAARAISSTPCQRKDVTSVDHSHGPPGFGVDPRSVAGLAYELDSNKELKPISRVRDGGDIEWAGIKLPTGQTGIFGPGSQPGEVATDFEQATGRERFELMYRMAGLDPWHTTPLQLPYAGTMKNPVFIWASNPFRVVGCTGYPKDSHDRHYMRVRMGPIASRCSECGTAYALDYCGPFRNEYGHLLSLAPGSTPENPRFIEDKELHAHDQFRDDVEMDFTPYRENWAHIESKRWEGWFKGETPDNWELLHADEATRQAALAEKSADTRPLAWWDFAKGNPAAAEATVENPKTWWGGYLLLQDHHDGHH